MALGCETLEACQEFERSGMKLTKKGAWFLAGMLRIHKFRPVEVVNFWQGYLKRLDSEPLEDSCQSDLASILVGVYHAAPEGGRSQYVSVNPNNPPITFADWYAANKRVPGPLKYMDFVGKDQDNNEQIWLYQWNAEQCWWEQATATLMHNHHYELR